MKNVFVHDTAEVHPEAILSENVKVWNWVQIRERAHIGENTILSKGVYVDYEVSIGKNCKIQNNVSVYHGVSLGDGVFLGPHVCFTNDRIPRAVNPDGSPKSLSDWTITPIQVLEGAAIGAHSVILPGIQLGSFSMVGSGSVVTRDVPDQALVVGNPARFHSWICKCGNKVEKQYQSCTTCEDKNEKSHK